MADSWIQGAFQKLLSAMSRRSSRAVDVVEQVLFRKWDAVGTRLDWMTAFWKSGLEHGHIAQWIAIFDATKPDLSAELWMAYGICLRRAGHRDAAHLVLQRASQESGLKGDFSTQSQVLIERAMLMRFQGDYVNAVALLQQAERCIAFPDPTQFNRIQFERSPIALDQGDGKSALLYLKGLDTIVDAVVLECEALLLLGEHEICRTTAAQALESAPLERRIEASLYTLVARSYQAEGQCDSAVTYFSLALTILEPTGTSVR